MNTTTLQNARATGINLEASVRDYLIFMDTSAFLYSNHEKFMHRVVPFLKKYNATIMVPSAVITELKRLSTQLEAADNAMKHIEAYTDEGYLRVLHSSERTCTVDSAFIALFAEQHAKHNLLLITDDLQLATEVAGHVLGDATAHAHSVKVARIDSAGELQPLQMPNIPEYSFH